MRKNLCRSRRPWRSGTVDFARRTKQSGSMAYTTYQARTHLSRLLREAEAGKEVIVLRGKKPVAKIVAIEPPERPKSEPPAR